MEKVLSLKLNKTFGDLKIRTQNEDQIKHVTGCLPACGAFMNEWSNQTIKLDALLNMHSPDAGCYGLELFKQDKFVYSLVWLKLGKTPLSVDFIGWAT